MKTLLSLFACLPLMLQAQTTVRYVGDPVAKLPATVTAPSGKVSLIADFDSAKPGDPVSVYLVNNSRRDVLLRAQGADVYLKLEMQNKAGEWVRAQPHLYSWCGNSYFDPPTVRKGHFMEIKGYQPEKGRKAKIRFRLYDQEQLPLVTQEGDGLYLKRDIEEAESDEMSLRHASIEFLAAVALGDKKLIKNKHTPDMRQAAIYQMISDRFTKEDVLPILDQIYQKCPQYRSEVSAVKINVNARK